MKEDEEIDYERLPIFETPKVDLGEIKLTVTKQRDIGDLTYESISYVSVPEGTKAERFIEIQIHEALKRPNLQWWEQVELEHKLHEMRQLMHGAGKPGRKSGWSLRDTATELNLSLGLISQDLQLAEAVMADANLKKITDKKTALKLVKAKAFRLDKQNLAGAPVEFDYNVVLQGDSAEILKVMPDNSFDVCFTDPPWLEYKDSKLVKDSSTDKVFEQVYRVMRYGSLIYIICSIPDFYVYRQLLPTFGFKVSDVPLIWAKEGMLSHGTRAWEYCRDYEPVLLAAKGSPVLATSGQPKSVYKSSIVPSNKMIHPHEKPVDVPMYFLSHSTFEGSIVLDPFAGSGVVGEACIRMNLRYMLIERDGKFHRNIEKRLEKAHKEFDTSSFVNRSREEELTLEERLEALDPDELADEEQ